MSNPTRAIICKCKRSFNDIMERCIGLPEQDFQDYLKFMKEMVDTRYEFIRAVRDEEAAEAEVRDLPAELHEYAVTYS